MDSFCNTLQRVGSGFSTPCTFFCLDFTNNSELEYFAIFAHFSKLGLISVGFQWTGSAPAEFQKVFMQVKVLMINANRHYRSIEPEFLLTNILMKDRLCLCECAAPCLLHLLTECRERVAVCCSVLQRHPHAGSTTNPLHYLQTRIAVLLKFNRHLKHRFGELRPLETFCRHLCGLHALELDILLFFKHFLELVRSFQSGFHPQLESTILLFFRSFLINTHAL